MLFFEAWEGCCVGDLEIPSDHLCENAFYCVPVILSTYRKVSALCKDMRGSRSSLYSAIKTKIVVSWRLDLQRLIALKWKLMHCLSDKRPARS